MFTNDFSGARHPEMLEDMIAVGPPKKALDEYNLYLPPKEPLNQPNPMEVPIKSKYIEI